MTLRLDLRGLNCPLPVLKTQKAMRGLAPGTLVEVLATDPLSCEDFADFCAAHGHTLLEASAADGVFSFLIRRGEDGP